MQARTAQDPPPSRASLLAVGALALGFATLVGYSIAPHGPAGWHFAMNNIATADSLLAGRGAYQSREQPFLSWPPLMPALIALLKLCGLRYVAATFWIAVGASFATSYFLARSVLELSGRLWVACAALAVLAVAPGFLAMMGSTLSQPLFLALSAAGVWLLLSWVRAPSRALEAGLVLTGIATSLHRYDGVVFAAVTAVVMALAPTASPPRARWGRAAAVATLSYLPIAAWLVRNRLVSGTWSGVRNPTDMTLVDQLRDLALMTGRWLAPDMGVAWLHTLLAAAVVSVTAVWLARELASGRRWSILAFAGFPIAYGLILAGIASRVEMDRLSDRLATPSAPFLLLLALLALSGERAGTREVAGRSIFGRRALALVAALFVGAHLAWNAPSAIGGVRERRAEGAGGFASPKWTETDLARWLRSNPLEGRLLSNSPELVLLAADRMPEHLPTDGWRERLADRSQPSVLVLGLGRRRDARLLERIRAEFEVRTLAEFEAGGVYRIEAEGSTPR